MALEGSSRGYLVHGMEGFDYDKARKVLQIPEDYQIEAMAAIGKHATKEKLSAELQKKEVPSPRRPVKQIVMKGKFEKRIEQALGLLDLEKSCLIEQLFLNVVR